MQTSNTTLKEETLLSRYDAQILDKNPQSAKFLRKIAYLWTHCPV